MNSDSLYINKIRLKSPIRFYLGVLARIPNYLKNNYTIFIARRNGATIGDSVSIPLSLAKKANKNLFIGNHTSIQTSKIDMRAPVNIGCNVILGSNVEILTCSHNVDSPDWEFKSYGISIEDYVWIATNSLVLPSCTLIEKGAVIGGGSVVFKNIKSMNIVSGNPATFIRLRKDVHYNLCVEELRGNDLKRYLSTRFNFNK